MRLVSISLILVTAVVIFGCSKISKQQQATANTLNSLASEESISPEDQRLNTEVEVHIEVNGESFDFEDLPEEMMKQIDTLPHQIREGILDAMQNRSQHAEGWMGDDGDIHWMLLDDRSPQEMRNMDFDAMRMHTEEGRRRVHDPERAEQIEILDELSLLADLADLFGDSHAVGIFGIKILRTAVEPEKRMAMLEEIVSNAPKGPTRNAAMILSIETFRELGKAEAAHKMLLDLILSNAE